MYKREGYLKHNNTESRESQEMMMMVMNFTLEVAKLNKDCNCNWGEGKMEINTGETSYVSILQAQSPYPVRI